MGELSTCFVLAVGLLTDKTEESTLSLVYEITKYIPLCSQTEGERKRGRN